MDLYILDLEALFRELVPSVFFYESANEVRHDRLYERVKD
jgi:hypothetical protein